MNSIQLFGALSFEERCRGAFADLLRHVNMVRADYLDYGSDATPGSLASSMREANWKELTSLGEARGVAVYRHRVNPYSMGDIERFIAGCLDPGAELVVDVTCLTRPHTLAFAKALALDWQLDEWKVAYSLPWSYGDLGSPHGRLGWRDTLLLPLGEDPSFSNEGIVLGLLLPGHEGERAMIALHEIEPAAGAIIIVQRDDRPDIHRVTLDRNRRLLGYLATLRVPGPLGEQLSSGFPWGRWESEITSMDAVVDTMRDVVHRLLKTAADNEAPVVLFPFGPKVAVFMAGFFLSAKYAWASWAVYPVARTHPLDYSDGIKRVMYVNRESIVRDHPH